MPRKQKTGIVVSDKMQKSIVVEVTSTKQHPLYKKFIRVRKRFIAHDEENQAQNGDTVRIEESRPLSRRKSWVLSDILRIAPGHGLAIKHTATAVASVDEDEARLSAGESGVAPAAETVGAVPAEAAAPEQSGGGDEQSGGGEEATEVAATATDEVAETEPAAEGDDEVQA